MMDFVKIILDSIDKIKLLALVYHVYYTWLSINLASYFHKIIEYSPATTNEPFLAFSLALDLFLSKWRDK